MKRIHPTPPYYPMTLEEGTHEDYLQTPPLPDIFNVMLQGIKTGKDSFTTAPSKEELLSRLVDVQTLPKSKVLSKYNLHPKTRAPTWFVDKVLKELKVTSPDYFLSNIHPVMMKPLVISYIYYVERSAFISNKAYPVFRHLLNVPHNYCLLVSRKTRYLTTAHSPFVTPHLATTNSLASGSGVSAYAIPFYLENNNLLGIHSKTPNLKISFLDYFYKRYGFAADLHSVLGYIYAILWHRQYRTHYCHLLRLDYPHIPFVKSPLLFLKLSTLGKQLIILHIQYPAPRPLKTTSPLDITSQI